LGSWCGHLRRLRFCGRKRRLPTYRTDRHAGTCLLDIQV